MNRNILFDFFAPVISALLLGIFLALLANGFVSTVSASADIRASIDTLRFSIGPNRYSLVSVISLILAALLICIIKNIFEIKAWRGPADTIFSAHSNQKDHQIKQGVGSTLAALVVASGGGSVGQYGPLVHLGSTIGLWIQKFTRLENDVLIGCGVAAAISAGFGAPIAGVLFAHEAILRHFSLRAVAPIFVASFSASAFSDFFWGAGENIFNVTSVNVSLSSLIIIFLLLGPIFSLMAFSFMRLTRFFSQYAESKSQRGKTIFLFSGALICGFMGIFYPEILGIGTASMGLLLTDAFSTDHVLMLFLLKLVMTSLCIGCGLFGGVFSPALFIGIAGGSIAASVMGLLGFDGYTQIVMIAGMAAVSSSVIGAPITSILLVLELTGSYQFAISAMVAVVIANLITHKLYGLSYFDRVLLDRGIDIKSGREAISQAQQSVMSCEGVAFTKISLEMTGLEALELMRENKTTESYIIDSNGIFRGKVDIFEAIAAGSSPISSASKKQFTFLQEDESIQTAMQTLASFVGESIPILSSDKSQLRKVITEGSLFDQVIAIQKKTKDIERS